MKMKMRVNWIFFSKIKLVIEHKINCALLPIYKRRDCDKYFIGR